MKNFEMLQKVCIDEVLGAGIEPGNIVSWVINRRAKTRWGMCTKNPDGTCIIQIAARLIEDERISEHIRMEVTEQQLLASWKEFFSTGTNWKDLDKDMTYEKYMAISDKEHINKILKMPVNYLQLSGDGFFVKRDGCALALSEKLQDVIDNPVFVDQMRDVIRYRTVDYYQRRYRKK